MRDPNDPNYKPTDYRLIGMILCGVAVVLFAYSAFSHRWLENIYFNDGRLGFSLIAFEVCDKDDCKATSTFALIRDLQSRVTRKTREEDKPSTMFAPAGVVTMAASLFALIALGAAVFFAYKRKRLSWRTPPQMLALLFIMLALLAGCLFVAKKPGGYGAVGVGPSFWAFAIACVVGIAGSQMLHKYLKPLDPDVPEA